MLGCIMVGSDAYTLLVYLLLGNTMGDNERANDVPPFPHTTPQHSMASVAPSMIKQTIGSRETARRLVQRVRRQLLPITHHHPSPF